MDRRWLREMRMLAVGSIRSVSLLCSRLISRNGMYRHSMGFSWIYRKHRCSILARRLLIKVMGLGVKLVSTARMWRWVQLKLSSQTPQCWDWTRLSRTVLVKRPCWRWYCLIFTTLAKVSNAWASWSPSMVPAKVMGSPFLMLTKSGILKQLAAITGRRNGFLMIVMCWLRIKLVFRRLIFRHRNITSTVLISKTLQLSIIWIKQRKGSIFETFSVKIRRPITITIRRGSGMPRKCWILKLIKILKAERCRLVVSRVTWFQSKM